MKFKLNLEKAPLHIAVQKRNFEIIQLLLKQKKIDVNIKTVLIILYIYYIKK